MQSTKMIVGFAVVIAISVICGTEGRPQQEPAKDYVEVDGNSFVFDGPVGGGSTPRNPPSVIPTFPTPNSIPTFQTAPNTIPTFTPPLVTPSSPATGAPVTPDPAVETCIRNCRFRVTSEYNPVCGTDGIVYNNPGTLICANACGRNVDQAYLGPCRTAIRG